MDRLYAYNHAKIDAYFKKNSDNFIVHEVPLYPFSGEGEHLIMKIRKKEITTWDTLKALSEVIGAKVKDFGYAGLKDKDGFTTQYISIHKKFENKLSSFSHEKIKILETTYHTNKIKIGHLKGNHFFVRLKKVNPTHAKIAAEVAKLISQYGIPNYFGYQRFGKEADNYNIGREILEGKRKEKNRKMKNFFISAYQSHLFNLWLSKRVEISKLFESFSESELFEIFNFPKEIIKKLKSTPNYFKLLPGDRLCHYPHGKIFLCENLEEESKRFFEKKIAPTGLLVGKKTPHAEGLAGNFEKDITKECENFCEKMNGARRFAWIFPEDFEVKYIEEKGWLELNFILPKGSYATVLLEELLHEKIEK